MDMIGHPRDGVRVDVFGQVNLDIADNDPRPVAPERPEPDECCNGGCERCIFDLYADALERYEQELAAWQARQSHAPPSR
jgi:hypothetical protein